MKYYIVAGEASGDLHGSNLMRGLFSEDCNADVRFWGGDLMAAVGGTLVHHYREGAVMGFLDVLKKARVLLDNVKSCVNDIMAWKPDVVILIDYPGFNLKVAEKVHEAGFKVFYYIAPKVWASREKRVESIRKYVDRLFIVFPFEIPFFEQKGIPFIYKGNPLIDSIAAHDFRPAVESGYIALLPGSRKGEISRMMPVCMEVADRLGCRVVIAGAPARSREDYQKYIGDRKNVELVFGRTYDLLKYADAAIVNSGTASLETVLIGTPQVTCYSTSPLNMFLVFRVLHVERKIRFISLANLCLGRLAFKELIQKGFSKDDTLVQGEFSADELTEEVKRLTGDQEYREAMLKDYEEIRTLLGSSGASSAVARAMIEELS